jgi:hypothetical protein
VNINLNVNKERQDYKIDIVWWEGLLVGDRRVNEGD